METTLKPTIDVESSVSKNSQKARRIGHAKRIPKYEKNDYAKMYRIMHKYRKRQRELLNESNIEDPYPYYPTYVFYCFTGKLED